MKLIDMEKVLSELCLSHKDIIYIDKNETAERIRKIPSIELEPKRGKWEEKETFHNEDDNPIIEEWQSARCSVCNKYHTTPYMYYFNDYNFCPNCGADMKGADDEV